MAQCDINIVEPGWADPQSRRRSGWEKGEAWHLAEDAKTEDEALGHYRRVRDEIRAFVESLPAGLEKGQIMDCCDGGPAASGCCGGSDDTRSKVREGYAKIAVGGGSCCGPGSCCGSSASADDVARAVGYSDEDLASLPEGANMGLSCGNPTALASLTPGEVVLDLGSGGGFDCFIAARKVAPGGRVVGVDMTPEMVSKARRNAEALRAETGLGTVEFRLGEMEHLPVADSSVDVVISNCVINLSPEKPQVWREIARVLRPGGRVAVSDIALLQALPDAVRSSVEALVGCIAGAVLVDETKAMVGEVGLVEAEFETESDYIDRMADWSDPLFREIASKLPPGSKPSDFVTSLKVAARKPGAARA